MPEESPRPYRCAGLGHYDILYAFVGDYTIFGICASWPLHAESPPACPPGAQPPVRGQATYTRTVRPRIPHWPIGLFPCRIGWLPVAEPRSHPQSRCWHVAELLCGRLSALPGAELALVCWFCCASCYSHWHPLGHETRRSARCAGLQPIRSRAFLWARNKRALI